MIEIGHRHEGTALVNATAVLVLSYTVGAMLSPALGAAALQWAPGWGFPALLAGGGGVGAGRDDAALKPDVAILRGRHRVSRGTVLESTGDDVPTARAAAQAVIRSAPRNATTGGRRHDLRCRRPRPGRRRARTTPRPT
ncbi:MAG: hypothetical protein HXY24_09855 [Rubrivivax sp.]|nr:hypothetical protein [Rubrivivax sp.]